MNNQATSKQPHRKKRVAISIEMDWGFKRHLEMYAGCQSYADEAGWDCTINPAIDRELRTEAGKNAYDGVLARVTESLADAAQKAKVPVVNMWMNSPAQNFPSVYPDLEAAGAMAAEHLLGRGFRQFGFLGFTRDVASRHEFNGFRAVTQREGFPCSAHRFSRSSIEGKALGWEAFERELEAWINTWKMPIGLFVCDDLLCRYLIDVCRRKGILISQEAAIVGLHNESEICLAPAPALTSIDLGYARIGYRAAALLDRLMSGESQPSTPELVAPAELIPRQSTDSFAADDPLVARALRFMSEQGHLRMQVNDVAAEVKTTRRTLERKFQESVGRTIAAEITRLRLERAKRRLVETDDSMKSVAKDSGFRSADHFYKVFARVEGYPPTQYREEHQQLLHQRQAHGG